jgi:hypothetical protein
LVNKIHVQLGVYFRKYHFDIFKLLEIHNLNSGLYVSRKSEDHFKTILNIQQRNIPRGGD